MRNAPDSDLRRLQVGCISASRAAIVGGDSTLFAFEGTTGRHPQYVDRNLDPIGESWAESTGALHARLSPRIQMITQFVPNKESCLSDLYPLPLGATPGRSWAKTRQMLSADPGILFGDALIDASRPERRTSALPWCLTDSRPSDVGTMELANELLTRLGIAPTNGRMEEVAPTRFEGDLAAEWGPTPVGEIVSTRVLPDAPIPVAVEGGAWPEWSTPDAVAQLTLVLVGDGHCGDGTESRHLTRWLASIFLRTVFIAAPVVPVDVLEQLRPDVVVYQATEGWMTRPAPPPVRLADVGGSGRWTVAP